MTHKGLARFLVRTEQLWRYYGVGLINTLVGFGLFSGLVRTGLNLYVAQFLSHFAGVMFNYVMHRRHVFTTSKSSLLAYLAAYVLNYGVGLVFLALAHAAVPSPYLAGFIALLCASTVNYFVLKFLVFKVQEELPS